MPRRARVADEPVSDDNAPPELQGGNDEDGAPEAAALARLRDIAARMEAEIAAGAEPLETSASSTQDADQTVPDSPDEREQMRVIEAMLFAASQPLDEVNLALHLKGPHDLKALLARLQAEYASRGVNLVRVAGKWAFRTAQDLSWLLEKHAVEEKRLSRAALETLSIIAYHQPVTRAEIEQIRGVTTSKGTLDVLLETGWIRPRGRRRAPGKPLTFGTTPAFLDHFGLDAIGDLPGVAELKASGLLDGIIPPDFSVPTPQDVAALMPDELPLDDGDDQPEQAELELDEPEDGAEASSDDDASEPPESSAHGQSGAESSSDRPPKA